VFQLNKLLIFVGRIQLTFLGELEVEIADVSCMNYSRELYGVGFRRLGYEPAVNHEPVS
jgi:hypothetical protein